MMETYSNSFTISPKKILFANFPADGHFNPLTNLAVELKAMGHDVRWYTSGFYAEKIAKLGIQHYPVKKALDWTTYNMEEVFPERSVIKGQVKKLKFDIINAFILRGPEYYEDIKDIAEEFDFDLLIADCAFTGIPFVKDLMKKPVLTMGILPLTETSKDLPPQGLGIEPSHNLFGKVRDAFLRSITNKFIFGEANKVLREVLGKYNISTEGVGVFDLMVRKSTLFLQSGTPGFEYKRSDLSKHIRFIGALLPHQKKKTSSFIFKDKWKVYGKRVLVTQGTVEKDPEKLIIPTLEALKDTHTLVIVTTGGWNTEELIKRYPQPNIVIQDFIPFDEVMPLMDVYVTNGGYGGVMLAIQNRLPMVVAGVHEGKLEINARVNYFKLGINLKTETPTPKQIADAVEKVTSNSLYKTKVQELALEFSTYVPVALTEKYIQDVTMAKDKELNLVERQVA